jgi:hypothetical protein
MIRRFKLHHPALFMFAFGLTVSLLATPLIHWTAHEHPLSLPSIIAFLFALLCFGQMADMAMLVERVQHKQSPFWRLRYANTFAFGSFLTIGLFKGIDFPSLTALAILTFAVALFGGLAFSSRDPEPQLADVPELNRPTTANGLSYWLWWVGGAIQLPLAIALSLVDIGGTAPAMTVLVLALAQLQLVPYPLWNVVRWRGFVFLALAAIAAATVGLFLA